MSHFYLPSQQLIPPIHSYITATQHFIPPHNSYVIPTLHPNTLYLPPTHILLQLTIETFTSHNNSLSQHFIPLINLPSQQLILTIHLYVSHFMSWPHSNFFPINHHNTLIYPQLTLPTLYTNHILCLTQTYRPNTLYLNSTLKHFIYTQYTLSYSNFSSQHFIFTIHPRQITLYPHQYLTITPLIPLAHFNSAS